MIRSQKGLSMNPLVFEPPVIAHRGASGYAPENTLSAFTKAAQMGIRWVEFDVMFSSDNVPIIFHDEKLSRTTDGQGLVHSYEYAYLNTLDAGSWFNTQFSGEKIPTLEEVLIFLNDTKMHANIEIKSSPENREKSIRQILDIVSSFNNKNSIYIFSSFCFETLKILRTLSSDCLIGLLLHKWKSNWEAIEKHLNCTSVHVNERILTRQRVRTIKQMNKLLLSYTVNNPYRAEQLFNWGVDAVFSDFPDRIIQAKPV